MFLAPLAELQTASAVAVVTGFAAGDALRAAGIVTAAAGHFAVPTDRHIALLARVAFFFIHARTTVSTAAAIPKSKLHKRAFRVVAPQTIGNQREEIQQSALGKRLTNGLPAIPFTEALIHDVWM